MTLELFTIGHSAHSWAHFIELLCKYDIQAVADVRSSPYSARFPHFNCQAVERNLKQSRIRYVFLGHELGARRTELQCYVDGVALYERIADTPAFRLGLQRLNAGMQRYRLILLCAEQDPLECHRTILVCRHVRHYARVQHILSNGSLESHTDAEIRLMKEEGVPMGDFFTSHDMLLEKAYNQRAAKIAYHECNEVAARR